jgi:hypothetical protein
MLLAASWAMAQEAAAPAGAPRMTAFEGDIRFGYRWAIQEGNLFAAEFEYPHSSLAGQVNIEYDPLPNRLLFEAYVSNEKDYHTELDYSYADIVMFNFIGRKFYRNMYHLQIPPSSIAIDSEPDREYFTDNGLNFARVRLKTPDFPLHLYLEARNQEKHGTIQQRFMRSYTAGTRISEGRNIDFETDEAKVTLNSHVKFFEIELSHAVKEFSNTQGKAMTDTFIVASQPFSYSHNQVSDIESSTSTVKVHTSHTGRIAAAATYSGGERENKDSHVKADFANAGLDFTWIPDKDVTVSLKYRHHEVSQEAPVTVNLVSPTGTANYSVKDALSTSRDIVSGYVRYRATDKLTVRLEAAQDTWTREFNDNPDPTLVWKLDKEISRLTMRLGATYYVHRRFVLRGDVAHQTADVPSTSVDNTYADSMDTARGSAIWAPTPWFSMVLSGATIMEKRDQQAYPFTGPRETTRNRAQSSFTFVIAKNTSITPSYGYFQNKTTAPIAYTDIANATTVEDGVPYADTSHIASIAVTHVLSDVVSIAADAARSWSRGSWKNAGVVAGSDGIAAYSSLSVVESELGGEVQLHFDKNVGSEFRYLYRTVDDKLDDAEDGTFQSILAMLTVAW